MPDTSVFIALDRERNLDLLGTDHSEQVALSVVVLGELLVAAKHPGRNREEREASMEFVEQLKASSVLPMTSLPKLPTGSAGCRTVRKRPRWQCSCWGALVRR